MVREADGPVLHRTHFSHAPSGRSALECSVVRHGRLVRRIVRTRRCSGQTLSGGQTARQRFSCHATGPMRRSSHAGQSCHRRSSEKRAFSSASMAAKSSKAKYRRRGGREFSPCRNVVTAARLLFKSGARHIVLQIERELGVALERIELLKHAVAAGPVLPEAEPPVADSIRRSALGWRHRAEQSALDRHGRKPGRVNLGGDLLSSGHENGGIRLGVLWFRRGQHGCTGRNTAHRIAACARAWRQRRGRVRACAKPHRWRTAAVRASTKCG